MYAPTASQMLRDDQRLRNLHRETTKRRKRFLAKQKRLEDEEENRRITALQNRRKNRSSHLSSSNRRRYNRNNHRERKPIKVHRPKISQADQENAFIVPVCDQLPSSSASPSAEINIKRPQKQKKIKPANNSHKSMEKKIDFELDNEENENKEFGHFDDAQSDQQSVAELDNFEKRHFGLNESVHYNNRQKSRNRVNAKIDNPNAPSSYINQLSNGYQQIFKKKVNYIKDQSIVGAANQSALKPLANPCKNPMNASMTGSLFNINDIDMKSPEDNDSVKINPNDSIDCGKLSFSTVYNSNLLPLQSVKSQLLPLDEVKENKFPKTRKIKLKKDYHPKFKRTRTNISCKSHQLPYKHQKLTRSVHQNDDTQSAVNISYGIKLPRLTQSILKEKDRIDSRRQQPPQKSPGSNYSAPVWNRYLSKDNGYKHPMNQRRNATTIIDDFFKEEQDDFLETNRQSNTTLFLPNINRSKLKPKASKMRKPAYSVISEYDMQREEDKLQKSLMKLNETLGALSVKEGHYYDSSKQREARRGYSKRRKYPNYMSETKVSNIPRKLKVRKAPTFKSKRRRGRWNI